MKSSKPKTRSAATKPSEFKHLTDGEQRALEMSDEAVHASGGKRETLIKKSKQAAKSKE